MYIVILPSDLILIVVASVAITAMAICILFTIRRKRYRADFIEQYCKGEIVHLRKITRQQRKELSLQAKKIIGQEQFRRGVHMLCHEDLSIGVVVFNKRGGVNV